MMDHQEAVAKVADIMSGAKFATLTTTSLNGELVSRPMGVQEAEFDGDLWFFTFEQSNKIQEIAVDPRCNVALQNKNSWVSLSGKAEVVHDRVKMEELWNVALKAWFPKELDEPGIVLLKVHADNAEYWDAPNSKVVTLFGVAKAAVTGKQAKPGENKTVDL